jgi:hypothetical protein
VIIFYTIKIGVVSIGSFSQYDSVVANGVSGKPKSEVLTNVAGHVNLAAPTFLEIPPGASEGALALN